MLHRLKALDLLSECTGDTIWPVEHCRVRGVPSAWIDDLADAMESGFDHDRNTIYLDQRPTNQFHGVRDVDLAIRLGLELGLDVDRLQSQAISRGHLVRLIKETLMEE